MSKKVKVKEKKVQKKPYENPEVPKEWLYMAPEGVKLCKVYEGIRECGEWEAEYWKEAEVLEIGIPEAGSVDLEEMDAELGDEALFSYMREKNIAKVYLVTIRPEYWERARGVMQYIAEKMGGFFCGDTKDFQPEVGREG